MSQASAQMDAGFGNLISGNSAATVPPVGMSSGESIARNWMPVILVAALMFVVFLLTRRK